MPGGAFAGALPPGCAGAEPPGALIPPPFGEAPGPFLLGSVSIQGGLPGVYLTCPWSKSPDHLGAKEANKCHDDDDDYDNDRSLNFSLHICV